MCNLDEVRIMLPALVSNVDIVSAISSPMLVVRYEKFHVFAIVGTAFQIVAMI